MKKKNIIIGAIIGVVLVVGLVVGGILLFGGKNEELNAPTGTPTAPATSTENLVDTMEKAETVSVDANTIEFAATADVKEGEYIAVWVYSKPKFLGYFKVVVNEGKKVIEGLEKALAKLDIEPGEHNIALVKEDGEQLGYMDIEIKKDGKIQKEEFEVVEKEEIENTEEKEEPEKEEKDENTTTKTITETEVIKYSTTKQTDKNMKKGTSKTVQEGVNGSKEVTYEVTYDADGKEISRKKVSEKVTKKAVNKIVKSGAADFNINTDKIETEFGGFMCTESQLYKDESGAVQGCDDMVATDQYKGVIINGVRYVAFVNNSPVSLVKLTKVTGAYKGTYKGKSMYFDSRLGGAAPEPLTQDFCTKHNMSCGQW